MAFCTQCGQEARPGAQFCAYCGGALRTSQDDTTTPLPPTAQPTTARKRSLLLPLTAMVVAGLIVGFIVFYVGRNVGHVELINASSPETDLWLEIDARPTPGRMAKLKPLLTALDQSGLESKGTDLLRRTFREESAPFTWDKDIKPWIGFQSALSVSRVSAAIRSGDPSEGLFLAMFTVRNSRQAGEWVSRLVSFIAKESHLDSSTVTHGKYTIHVLAPRGGGSVGERLAFAVAGRVLYVSNQPDEIVRAADGLKHGKDTLAQADWYKQLEDSVPDDALVRFLCSPQVVQSIYSAPEISRELGLSGDFEVPSQALAYWFDIGADGLHGGGTEMLDKTYESRFQAEFNTLRKADVWNTGFRAVPKESVAVLAIEGVSAVADIALKWVAESPFAPMWQQAEREVEMQTGLILSKDVLGWISGLTAAFIGIKADAYHLEALDLVGEMRGRSASDVQASVAKLTDALNNLLPYGLGFGSADIDGVDCHMMDVAPGIELCYGVDGDALLIASSRDAIEDAISARRRADKRISASAIWKATSKERAKGHYVAFLMDTPGLVQDLQGTLSSDDREHGGQQALDIASSVSWVSTSAGLEKDRGTSRFAVAIDYDRLLKGIASLVEMAQGLPDVGRESAFAPHIQGPGRQLVAPGSRRSPYYPSDSTPSGRSRSGRSANNEPYSHSSGAYGSARRGGGAAPPSTSIAGADTAPSFVLVGVVNGSPPLAIIRANGERHYVKVGDSIGNHRVQSIEGSSVVLAGPDGPRTLFMIGGG